MRAPELALLVAGRKQFDPDVDDHIEVPVPQPVLVLDVIDGPDADGNAHALQRRLEEQHDALGIRIVRQQFTVEWRAGLAVHQLVVTHLISRLLEELHAFAQVAANRFGIAADRIAVRRREHLGRNFGANGLEDFKLPALGQPLDASSVPSK